MFNFREKKAVSSPTPEEYSTISKRIIDLDSRISKIELTMDEFRNKILRKLQVHYNHIEQEAEITEPVKNKYFGGVKYVNAD